MEENFREWIENNFSKCFEIEGKLVENIYIYKGLGEMNSESWLVELNNNTSIVRYA